MESSRVQSDAESQRHVPARWRRESGAVGLEYALLVALVALVLVGGAATLGGGISAFYEDSAGYVASIVADDGLPGGPPGNGPPGNGPPGHGPPGNGPPGNGPCPPQNPHCP